MMNADKTTLLATVVAGSTLFAGGAVAQTMLQYFVSQGGAIDVLNVDISDGTVNPDGSFFWSLPSPVTFDDFGQDMATLTSATAFFDPDGGLMATSFALEAIQQVELSVFGLPMSVNVPNALGRATAGVTVTDGNLNGASAVGSISGIMFASQYNGSTGFAGLLPGSVSAGSGGSNSASDEFPAGAGNYSPLGASATDMQFSWGLGITAGDQVSGTSAYSLIPAPGSVAIVGLGLAGMTRRRR